MHTVLFRRGNAARPQVIFTAVLLCGALLGSVPCAPAVTAAPAGNPADGYVPAIPGTALTAITLPTATAARRLVALGPSRTIHSGQPAVLGAYGSRPGKGTRVVLQRYQGTSWRPIGSRRTDRNGRAYFHVAPGWTSYFRVLAPGTQSGVAKIRVSRRLFMMRGNAIVAEASRYRGAPYVFGAAGPYAFDCSGFTQFIYRKFGHSLPHSATAQARLGVRVPKAAAQPGDLVLFGGRGGRYYHAAIYAGRGYMWDASTYGRPVALRRIFSQAFVVRRVI